MASSTNPKTIHLSPEEIRCPREGRAYDAITPGMLIERAGNSSWQFQPHSSAGGGGQLSFALEYDLTGRTIDDNYVPAPANGGALGDNLLYFIGLYGDLVYAILDAGEVAQENDWLASAGNGFMRVAQSGDAVIAQALESINAAAAPTRIVMELAPCCIEGGS